MTTNTKMPVPNPVTAEFLLELRACDTEVGRFRKDFPHGVRLTLAAITRAALKHYDLTWFASKTLTAAARAEYDKATAAARAEYDKAAAAARAEYGKATAPAWAEYGKATAAAGAECGKATAAAWAEYDKAAAAAWAEYDKATAPVLYHALTGK